MEGTPAAQAMARLASAESAVASQAEAFTTLSRQVDKLQIRSRIVGRDVKDQVKAAQAATASQSETVIGATMRLQQLESDVRTVEELVDAMQGLAAKQFDLLLAVIEQQKKTSQGAGKKAPQKKDNGNKMSSQLPKSIKVQRTDAAPSYARSQYNPPLNIKNKQSDVEGSNKQIDEWGRKVSGANIPLQQQEKEAVLSSEKTSGSRGEDKEKEGGKKVHLNEDGSVSYSF